MDRLNHTPDVILARERRRWQKGVFLFLALAVALTTIILLINPAVTEEYQPICGIEEHEHGPECYETVQTLVCPWEERAGHVHSDACYEIVRTCVCGLEDDPEHEHTDECYQEERVLVCGFPENTVHEHTEACIEWREELICEIDDPGHEHTEACYRRIPVFVCEAEEGVGHVHNDLCYVTEEVLTCTKEAHVHTDACYPKLTGDPHQDVEMDIDWESTFCDVTLTGDWAEDLVAIAESQLGYRESEKNFITDEFNVKHGYTRYGDWYGVRYAGWGAIYAMFCMHYAEIWGVPTDSVPANWMNMVRAKDELWLEADGEPKRGDLVFFDDDADGFADRVAIVTEVREDGITAILGGTQTEVHREDFGRAFENIAGYLSLPENPDPPDEDLLTLDAKKAAEATGPGEIVLTAQTADGRTVTFRTAAESLPYPAEELLLTAELLDAEDCSEEMALIEAELNAGGCKVREAQFYDIAVWRCEPVQPAADQGPPDPAEQADDAAERIPADEPEEIIEFRRTQVVPEGPYEVTVDGYAEDVQVWQGTVNGLRSLTPAYIGDRVTVTPDLN